MRTKILLIALFVLSPSHLFSDQVTFEVTTVGTGSLGNLDFTNELVTIRGVGDTDNVDMNGSVNLLLQDLDVYVDIEGLDTAMFTDAIQAISNNNSNLGGFGNTSNNFGLLFVNNPAFAAYDLTTDLGPISGSANIVNGVGHETDAGSFRLFGTNGSATFQATVVPEPATGCLLAMGWIAASLKRRRLQR